ncbi:MAG: SUMF1/EgtB/PvdO family nonheme iron enzyme [Chloroflexota bacterium]
MSDEHRPPKVFISYAWEDDVKPWVLMFAKRLRKDGVETVLDLWETDYGDQLPVFMEKAVRESDFVILICTPKYKKKSDSREGGVGYEGHIITAEIFEKNNHRKFVPVLRKGGWVFAAPSWAAGKLYIDLSGNPYNEANYRDLLRTLHGRRPTPPPIGEPPDFPEEDDSSKKPNPFLNFYTTVRKHLSESFIFIKSVLPKTLPLLRIAGFTGVAVMLLWGGSWAVPKIVSFLPTPRATSTQRSVIQATSTNSSGVPTKTIRPISTPTKITSPTRAFTATIVRNSNDFTDVDPEDNSISMRLVPAGEFTMGATSDQVDQALAECQKVSKYCEQAGFLREQPSHKVYLDAFYMDTYEVTNANYKACVDSGICTPPKTTPEDTIYSVSSNYYSSSQFNDYPVINVDWSQAKTYCEWRSSSLPTEAQWEKAARSTDGRTYPWGEGFNCNRVGCNYEPHKVGSFESGKSPYSIYDLAGNVWEWVADLYDPNYYSTSPYSNPLGPSSGQYRVLRGGSWANMYSGYENRTTNRYWYRPSYVYEYTLIGFRCVRSP